MRHGHGLRKLNRTSEHRLAMLRNMMNSLLQHEVTAPGRGAHDHAGQSANLGQPPSGV